MNTHIKFGSVNSPNITIQTRDVNREMGGIFGGTHNEIK